MDDKKLSSFEKRLMLDEITFYSICSEADCQKILGQRPMSFKDFRRLSLLTDYLNLTHLHQFIWDMHAYKFLHSMDRIYAKCSHKDKDVAKMLVESAKWLNDFATQAPNAIVSYLLQEIFKNGLGSNKDERHERNPS